MSKLGVGIIGGAGGVAASHLAACQANPEVEIRGLCDTNAEGVARVAREHNIPFCCTDYHELLARKDIQIIFICTPDCLHEEQALDALQAGKHVLVAKPMATTLTGCKALVKAVGETGLKLMVGMVCRFEPINQAIKKIYDEGTIGEAFFVEGSYIHAFDDLYEFCTKTTPWRGDLKTAQNFLLGGSVHPLDLLKWIVQSDIEEAFAYSNHKCEPRLPQEDCYIMVFKFANRCLGKTLLTVGCKGHGMGEGMLSIWGTKGTVWKGKLYLQNQEPQDIPVEEALQVAGHPFQAEIDHFVDCVIDNRTPLIDVIDGAKTTAALIAGTEAAQTGRPVKVFNQF